MVRAKVRLACVCLSAFAVATACTSAPPVQEMSDARQAIASAVEAGAAQHAPTLIEDAQRLIALAESQLREEAFGRARMNAVRAKNRAARAQEDAAAAMAEP